MQQTPTTKPDLGALADAAKDAIERGCIAIDDAVEFVEASNRRIALLESAASQVERRDA